MSNADRDRIERIARTITDGRPIDWDALSALHPDLISRLRHLRRIQSLAETSRRELQGSAVAAGAPAAPGAAAGVATKSVATTVGTSTDAARSAQEGRAPEQSFGARSLPFAWGPLQVLEKIGEGSFGEVFLAHEPTLQREVALKLMRGPLDPGQESTLHLEEARRLARVRHPNVLTVHGVEVHDDRAGMWTDFLRGETLERRIRRSDPVSAEDIAAIAADLCRALAAVHAAGIIHGDVKASNVMCEADGRVILMDFGAGSFLPSTTPDEGESGRRPRGRKAGRRSENEASRESSGIAARTTVGTPLVMAPELFAGEPTSVASDVYALGVLLHRLATGCYPVEAKTERQLLARLRKGSRVPLAEIRPDLPTELTLAIERALATDPGARFHDAVEMGNVIVAAMGRSPIESDLGKSRPGRDRLPRSNDRFIGRERELATVRRLVVKSPVVSLVGPGGSGKSRLALQVAHDLLAAFPDGVVWIDLAPLSEAHRVTPAILQALESRATPGTNSEEALLELLAGKSRLLVLDNCEHMSPETTRLIQLIRSGCPKVRFLMTSREALGAKEEERFPVPPLSLPPLSTRRTQHAGLEVAECEAVRLFVDRAHDNRPGFTLTRANAGAITRICRRLDGIPLAIELAAARVKVLPVDEIARRLDESFRILGSAEAGTVPRQKTLEASIDWSYQLLSPVERTLLRRLSVFSGRWTLEAAEAVCRDPDQQDPRIDEESILDLMASLVEKSLVTLELGPEDPAQPMAGDPEPRVLDRLDVGVALNAYRMLEMVRQFAGRKLSEAGELDAVQVRHLEYCASVARAGVTGLSSRDQAVWARRLDWEHENFLAVFRWVETRPQYVDEAMAAAVSLGRYWNSRSLLDTARHVLETLLTLPNLAPEKRGRGLASLATFAHVHGDDARVVSACEQALPLLEEDAVGKSEVLLVLGLHFLAQKEYAASAKVLEEAADIRRGLGRPDYTATVLCNLGVTYAYAGDLVRAKATYEEALTLSVQAGDQRAAAQMVANLAATALDQNDLPEAKRWADEALQRLRAIGEGLDASNVLWTLATIAREEGDARLARSRELESISGRAARRDSRDLARNLAGLACTCVLEEDFERAARLFGAFETTGAVLDPGFAARTDRFIGAARARLGESRYQDLKALGRALTLEQALALAGAADALVPIEPPRPIDPSGRETQRSAG